jgi:SAM-dependent methyltransferase
MGRVVREDEGEILEGALLCPVAECQHEHPIIDGIPIIVADIGSVVANQLGSIRARDDLSPFTESVLGDCAGTGSDFARERQHLSSYARGHYGDLDPDEPDEAEGGLADLLQRCLEMLPAPPSGLWLDAGCSVGRGTFELAARTDDLVLGVDLSFAMLKLARRVARTGKVAYSQRRVGLVYDRRAFDVDLEGCERIDFWACDATALPFDDHLFDGLCSVNLLDCTASPLAHLIELGRVLRPGKSGLITSPYDWSEAATAVQGWLGGHSQRAEAHGSSIAELRRVLSDEAPTTPPIALRIAAELDDLPWRVFMHERATMLYKVHALLVRAIEQSG